MNLILLAILGSTLFWLGWFAGAIVESNNDHAFLDEYDEDKALIAYVHEPDYSTMQEDTLAYAAPDPVVKKRGRPLGSKNKAKELA